MPILLDDIQTSVPVKTYNPKFFDSRLTGTGKKIGVLNEFTNPMHVKPTQTTTTEHTDTMKRKYTNGQTEVVAIPVNPLTHSAWSYMEKLERPDVVDMTKIATGVNNGEYYIHMMPHSLILEETDNGQSGKSRKLTTCYQMFLFCVNDINDTKHVRATSAPAALTKRSKNCYHTAFTCTPKDQLDTWLVSLSSKNIIQDQFAINTFIADYNLYSAMCKRSEEWQSTIDLILDQYFENVAVTYSGNNNVMNGVAYVLRHIEDYAVPLDLYRNIYASITKHFKHDDAVTLCKQNLNLLLSDTLNNLNANKSVLTCVQPPVPPAQIPMSVAKFSPEQQNAITSTEPLVLVQAGAGTGKSTVILGRIDWMIASGVNPSDITVLSFTNAAADNITAKNPNIHSMTIARMIHNIYTANFQNHELSSIETIINSLDIYYPTDDMANRFKNKLKGIVKNDSDGFTSMNNFIEHHYDEVISMLDTIRQTSLELEIIICYQKIDQFIEPPDVQSKFLIIDEVQDNSIFEFIYTLKYVDKHKESLFIVGDCSQTLYEFRASNPKALNVLEGSGVFATYQLQVNYRSNQEILDFANVALQNIEANQYAQIQLRANNLKTVTEQSFTDAVKFKYHRLAKIADFNNELPGIMKSDVKTYIDACLARGEQVAFLAFTRNHVALIEGILKDMYPTKALANLVPKKMYNTTVFSEFIKKYWNEIKFVPTQSITSVIVNEVTNRLGFLVFNPTKMGPAVAKMLYDWRTENQTLIDSWQQQHMNGRMTLDAFLNNVRECMLQFEIRSNAIKQALLSARNEEAKKAQNSANADLLLSTIHSAKGLEFDNVVIIYRNENDLAEDKKRMYYVAFTRAMNSEYVIAYDTVASPKIKADYETIVDHLHQKYPMTVTTPVTQIAHQAQAFLAAQNGAVAAQTDTDDSGVSNAVAPVVAPYNASQGVANNNAVSGIDDDDMPFDTGAPVSPVAIKLPAGYMAMGGVVGESSGDDNVSATGPVGDDNGQVAN